MSNHKGRCRDCRHSLMRQLYDGFDDFRIWQYCWHYRNWCKLAGRNCFTAFIEISVSGRKNRDAEEAAIRKTVEERKNQKEKTNG